MSLFDRPKDTGLTPERIREVCDALPEPALAAPEALSDADLERLWCELYPMELPCERRWSPAKRARLDQLRAEFRETSHA